MVTPNPFSSGSAKWNLLAPYAVASRGGADPAAGLAFVSALVSDHVRLQPKSGREATEAFLHGSGDALLSYENEALFLERDGEPVEHVTPAQTFRIDNPVAVLSGSAHRATARAFVDFLFTPTAQTLLAEAGFRPVDPGVAAGSPGASPPPHDSGPSPTSAAGHGSTPTLRQGQRHHRGRLRQGDAVSVVGDTETRRPTSVGPPPGRPGGG